MMLLLISQAKGPSAMILGHGSAKAPTQSVQGDNLFASGPGYYIYPANIPASRTYKVELEVAETRHIQSFLRVPEGDDGTGGLGIYRHMGNAGGNVRWVCQQHLLDRRSDDSLA